MQVILLCLISIGLITILHDSKELGTAIFRRLNFLNVCPIIGRLLVLAVNER